MYKQTKCYNDIVVTMEKTIEKRFYYKLNKYKGSNEWNFSFYIYKLKLSTLVNWINLL